MYLRVEFACERLCERARSKLGHGDVSALGKALDGRGCTGEEQRTRTASHLSARMRGANERVRICVCEREARVGVSAGQCEVCVMAYSDSAARQNQLKIDSAISTVLFCVASREMSGRWYSTIAGPNALAQRNEPKHWWRQLASKNSGVRLSTSDSPSK